MPAILFSSAAFISAVSTRVFLKAALIFRRFFAAYHTSSGIKAKMIAVSGRFIELIRKNDGTSSKTASITSSGPWWASSEISCRSFIMRDIIAPVL